MMQDKIIQIYNILLKEYGSQGWWPINNKYKTKDKLTEKEKFEICIGAILTQNTSWKNVEKALNNLRINNLLNKKSIENLDIRKLAELIKSSGYNNQKAKKLKEFINFINSKEQITRDNLLKIWGIGKETADSILLYAHKKPVFVIDSYTKRIFSRLGLCNEKIEYDDLQDVFHNNLKSNHKLFNEYHALLVEHAKRYCKTKPECKNCPLNKECEYFKNSKNLIKY